MRPRTLILFSLLAIAWPAVAACVSDGQAPQDTASAPGPTESTDARPTRAAPAAREESRGADVVPDVSTPFPPPPQDEGPEEASDHGHRGADEPAGNAPRAPWPAEEGVGILSNGGRYWVVYLPPPPEIPLNEEFEIELRVFDGATRSRLVDAEVQVDARMPAHGHGMKIDAEAIRQPDGSFRVPILLLHMTGHWELYVDLTEGALTERAQFDIDLE